MKRRFRVRPQADRDIDELAEFIARTDLEAGLDFLDEVAATIEKLASSPGLGSPCEFQSTRYGDLRYWPVHRFRNHIIFFREVPNGIEVIRVLHGARDYSFLFGD